MKDTLRNKLINESHACISYIINFSALLNHMSIIRILFVFGRGGFKSKYGMKHQICGQLCVEQK